MNIRLVYIRHADKEYVNGYSETYKHDPGITKHGADKSKHVSNKLIEKWGYPSIIVSSPYRRCRETAIIMKSMFKKDLKIIIDKELSEYLGNHKNSPLDVTPETKIHHPPHPESFDDMKKRVNVHYNKMLQFSKHYKDKVVWLVTHGIIIKQIAHLNGVKISKTFPSLTCLSVIEDPILNGEVYFFKS